MLITADHDDRVVPAHSHKFAAELQYRLGSKLPDTPLLIRVDENSGHGSGKPISKWVCIISNIESYCSNDLSNLQIEEYTDIVSFVLNSLKIDYKVYSQKHKKRSTH